jgi:hypothetical protein
VGVGLTGWRKFLPRVYDAFFGGFSGLTPAQEEAIPVLLEGRGLLLVAPTASVLPEAVTAPLAERALDFPGQTFGLYVCPTRALANDLEGRLKERHRRCGLRLAIRHGERDTAAAREAPAFILTTPESLEVILGSPSADRTRARLREVRAVVVDEAHQFFGTRRGLQLYFLLERLKGLAGPRSGSAFRPPWAIPGLWPGSFGGATPSWGSGWCRAPGPSSSGWDWSAEPGRVRRFRSRLGWGKSWPGTGRCCLCQHPGPVRLALLAA